MKHQKWQRKTKGRRSCHRIGVTMKCVVCNKSFDEFNGYISAFDTEQPLESSDYRDVENLPRESICSKECFSIHLKKFGKGRYNYSEITYCPSAKECEKLGNLRKLCEMSEHIKTENDSFLDNLSFIVSPGKSWCEAGVAGMIKSNMQLYKSNLKVSENIERFNRVSTRLSYMMIILTVVMLLAVIATYFK